MFITLFVPQKEIFTFATRDMLAMNIGFFAGEDGRVGVFGVGDIELFEGVVDVMRHRVHGGRRGVPYIGKGMKGFISRHTIILSVWQ